MTGDNAWHDRLSRLFAAIDAKDTERFLGFLTNEASFRFGSAPAVNGRGAIRAAVDRFFATIAGSRHVLERTVAGDDVMVCEGEVTYTRHDGTEVSLPFANVFELEGGIISAYKIYVDAGPLYN
ncbi:MAG: nuclear transport factor 2 family protein [Woeseiaceae bacterium]|nr:nuclear transport factor 2 family protein [Woeseiaceae bacterium]